MWASTQVHKPQTDFPRLTPNGGATASQLAIGWALAKGPGVVPLVGARIQHAESLGAVEVTMKAADVERIEAGLPPAAVAGTRYDEHQMRVFDSER